MELLNLQPLTAARRTAAGARQAQPQPARDQARRLRTILVATDFSAISATVTSWALALARQHGASVRLVHAIEPGLIAMGVPELLLSEEVQRNLASASAQFREAGIEASSEVHFGKPWPIIAESARRAGADLIVVGARGRSACARHLLGSTSDRVIRTAAAPVLVVHPGDAERGRAIRSILVPTDFSEEAALATSMAMRLLKADGNGGTLTLLHACASLIEYVGAQAANRAAIGGILPMGAVAVPRCWDEEEREARRKLESIASSLRGGNVSVRTRVFRGYPVDGIEREAAGGEYDLIAMGTRGHSGLHRLLIGSNAERVLRHAACPVLTVRQPDADEPIHIEGE